MPGRDHSNTSGPVPETRTEDPRDGEVRFSRVAFALPLEYAYYLITLEELTDHPHTAAFRDWLLEEALQEDELNSSQ